MFQNSCGSLKLYPIFCGVVQLNLPSFSLYFTCNFIIYWTIIHTLNNCLKKYIISVFSINLFNFADLLKSRVSSASRSRPYLVSIVFDFKSANMGGNRPWDVRFCYSFFDPRPPSLPYQRRLCRNNNESNLNFLG